VQAVFDVGSGEFRGGAASDGGDPEVDPTAEEIAEELRAVDVAETAPVELLDRVQEWQRRLDEE